MHKLSFWELVLQHAIICLSWPFARLAAMFSSLVSYSLPMADSQTSLSISRPPSVSSQTVNQPGSAGLALKKSTVGCHGLLRMQTLPATIGDE